MGRWREKKKCVCGVEKRAGCERDTRATSYHHPHCSTQALHARTFLGHLLHHGVGFDGKSLEGAAVSEVENEKVGSERRGRSGLEALSAASQPPLFRWCPRAHPRRHTTAHARRVGAPLRQVLAEPEQGAMGHSFCGQAYEEIHALGQRALFFSLTDASRSSWSPVGQSVDEDLVQQVIHDPGEEGHGWGVVCECGSVWQRDSAEKKKSLLFVCCPPFTPLTVSLFSLFLINPHSFSPWLTP